MVLADPPFEIDVTEQRPRPLIPAPHPSPPPKRNTTESHHDSAGQGLFQRPVNEHWEESNAIHLAAYILWKLNWIHPFADGNGRTARAVSYAVLCIKLDGLLP